MRFISVGLATIASLAWAGVMTASSAQAMTKPATPTIGSSAELAAGTRKAAGAASRSTARPGPGRCGTMKYWDRKTRTCLDATQKKTS